MFVGGGTPTLLPPADLVRMLAGIRDRFGLPPGAEVTTEANPDSVTPECLEVLADGGFTRVSLGMQSAVPHVLRDPRAHPRPGRTSPRAVDAARAAGLQVSLDLIYGTPGESLRRLADQPATPRSPCEPDHVSAYALVVEDGTKLAAQVRRGQVPAPEDDDEAAKYEIADEHLAAAGYGWYEVSNWARRDDARCRHNEGYWADGNWWGIGPGAHSHVGGVRWWNVKHPNAYAAAWSPGSQPGARAGDARPTTSGTTSGCCSGCGWSTGCRSRTCAPTGGSAVAGLIADGLVDGDRGPAPTAGGADEAGPPVGRHRRAPAAGSCARRSSV